jgi:hypothetical protein
MQQALDDTVAAVTGAGRHELEQREKDADQARRDAGLRAAARLLAMLDVRAEHPEAGDLDEVAAQVETLRSVLDPELVTAELAKLLPAATADQGRDR